MNSHRLSIFNRIILTLTVLLLAVMVLSPARAQDAEPTAEANPAAVVTEEAQGPVSVDMGTGDVTIITGDSTPDTPVEPVNSVPVPVVIGGSVLIGIVFIGLLYNFQVVIKLVGGLIPAEAVPELVDAILPKLVEGVMNTLTPRIPGTIDDALFIEAARQRGLTAVRDDITGMYHVAHSAKPAYPPAEPLPRTGPPF